MGCCSSVISPDERYKKQGMNVLDLSNEVKEARIIHFVDSYDDIYENLGRIGPSVKDKLTNATYAVKEVDKTSKGFIDVLSDFKREAEILSRLDHPNICKLRGIYEGVDRIRLVLEYCPGGNLFDRIFVKQDDGSFQVKTFSEPEAAYTIKHVLSALSYLHSRMGVLHRDIKLHNFMYSKCGRVKLLDFGFSVFFRNQPAVRVGKTERLAQSKSNVSGSEVPGSYGMWERRTSEVDVSRTQSVFLEHMLSRAPGQQHFLDDDPILRSGDYADLVFRDREQVGSPFYLAPEIIKFRTYSPKSDVWAVGVMLYIMLCGKAPFGEFSSSLVEICQSVVEGEYEKLEVSDCCLLFLGSLLSPYPVSRPSADEALLDDWIERTYSMGTDLRRLQTSDKISASLMRRVGSVSDFEMSDQKTVKEAKQTAMKSQVKTLYNMQKQKSKPKIGRLNVELDDPLCTLLLPSSAPGPDHDFTKDSASLQRRNSISVRGITRGRLRLSVLSLLQENIVKYAEFSNLQKFASRKLVHENLCAADDDSAAAYFLCMAQNSGGVVKRGGMEDSLLRLSAAEREGFFSPDSEGQEEEDTLSPRVKKCLDVVYGGPAEHKSIGYSQFVCLLKGEQVWKQADDRSWKALYEDLKNARRGGREGEEGGEEEEEEEGWEEEVKKLKEEVCNWGKKPEPSKGENPAEN